MRYRSARSILGLVIAVGGLGCGGEPAPAEAPPPASVGGERASVPATGRLDSSVRPTRYRLELTIDPREEGFSGRAEITLSLPEPREHVVLHAHGLEVNEARVSAEGGEPAAAEFEMLDAERGWASVRFDAPVGPGEVRLAFAYRGAWDSGLEGLYRVSVDEDHYAFTQMEPLAARKAFPSFDEPSFKTPFEVVLVVPEGQAAIANAGETSSRALEGGLREVHFAPTEPLPTYLVAFAVGPFDIVEAPPIDGGSIRERPLPFRGVAPRGRGEDLAHAMTHTPALLRSLEGYFGIAYPYDKLDIIAVPDFGAGAMENAGAITFRDSLLLLGEGPSARQARGFAFVMAHELAHQWFGNLVTMEWWDDLWLNEAFASWMETRAIAEVFPEMAPEIAELERSLAAMNADSLMNARRIRQPIESDHDIHNAFDAITYQKGQGMLSMFERWIGPEVFRRGVRAYLERHAGGNATASDFFAALSEAAGRDVSGPFESFITQPGVPLVNVQPTCEDDQANVRLSQSRYLPAGSQASSEASWQIPICVRIGRSGGMERICTLLDRPVAELALPGGGCPDWVLPNADGAGYYRFSLEPDALTALGRALPALTVRERLVYADSVRAAEVAGRLDYADAMAALAPLAAAPERQVALAPLPSLRFALDELVEGESRRAAQAYTRALYEARARRLRWAPGASADEALLASDLLSLLALDVDSPDVRSEARRRGHALLGLGRGGDGSLRRDEVAPDLASVAIAVAVQEGGEEVFAHVEGLLAETRDGRVRGDLLGGLAATRDPALRRRALGLLLDDRVRVNETFRILMGVTRDAEGEALAFDWMRENYERLAERVGPGYAGYLPFVGSGFCSAERAAELRAFFAERVAQTAGGPRNLESVVEGVELCAARAAAARESARTFFAERPRRGRRR